MSANTKKKKPVPVEADLNASISEVTYQSHFFLKSDT